MEKKDLLHLSDIIFIKHIYNICRYPVLFKSKTGLKRSYAYHYQTCCKSLQLLLQNEITNTLCATFKVIEKIVSIDFIILYLHFSIQYHLVILINYVSKPTEWTICLGPLILMEIQSNIWSRMLPIFCEFDANFIIMTWKLMVYLKPKWPYIPYITL